MPRGQRSAKARRATKLAAQGKDYREVARLLRVSEPYAWYLINDPGGERRLAMYRASSGVSQDDTVECRACHERFVNLGAHLVAHGLDGEQYRRRYGEDAPLVSESFREIARDLYRDKVGQRRPWTRERVIQALQRQAKQTGKIPRATDWQRPLRRKASGLMLSGEWRPNASTVVNLFGSWSAGLRAAGLEPRRPGGQVRTHCKRGHPLTEENVYRRKDGGRQCLICMRAGHRRWLATQR